MQLEGRHCVVPPPPSPAAGVPVCCPGIHTLVPGLPVCGLSVYLQNNTEWNVLATLRETFIANQGRMVKWQYAAFESGTDTFTIHPARRRERCDDYELRVSRGMRRVCFGGGFIHQLVVMRARCEG